jgi:hypothetical protein
VQLPSKGSVTVIVARYRRSVIPSGLVRTLQSAVMLGTEKQGPEKAAGAVAHVLPPSLLSSHTMERLGGVESTMPDFLRQKWAGSPAHTSVIIGDTLGSIPLISRVVPAKLGSIGAPEAMKLLVGPLRKKLYKLPLSPSGSKANEVAIPMLTPPAMP